MNIYIYKNNTETNKDELLVGVIAPSLEEFNKNPSKFYPPLPEGLFVASEHCYDHPVIEGSTVREKTREERILIDNELELLYQGEYIDNNEILVKDCPNNLYKPQWVYPNWVEGATLDEVKEEKRIELKKERDKGIYEPYLYELNGHIYDADLDSRNRLFQAQQLGVGTTENINWITADNQIAPVSNNDLINIVNGIAFREQELFSKFSNKYNQVLSCITIEEVKSVNWY